MTVCELKCKIKVGQLGNHYVTWWLCKFFSLQQWIRVPLSPQPCQYHLPFVLLVLVILTFVTWNVKVALSFISLITHDILYFFKCFLDSCSSSSGNSLLNCCKNYKIQNRYFDFVHLTLSSQKDHDFNIRQTSINK